ncbi:hypothetical protein BABINDRAFT_159597 [Babjeviella inositovora NRRL Y-12698]|uniref:Uncharacterized protein n=1 Tax=Babjeviella inositovora NRRL Y-12698 TaxID=984486 RepID=A0A1E3QZM9_9ASCO|nr:uncharacterized protein BABINDRAFT_159597 [Babjeviella inositovora NRRL Y-12698]ODQ83149.1 hypothetical protein BABINDRAFT_159597 [Babjeviella inositovora NRRL Y-12698]
MENYTVANKTATVIQSPEAFTRNMHSLVLDRILGKIRPLEFSTVLTEAHYTNLTHTNNPEFPVLSHLGAINTLSLERLENRFLLSGGADAVIKIWDTRSCDPVNSPYDSDKVVTVALIPKKVAHTFGVSCVKWWPFDNEMFVSSSFDHTVKIWDTNSMEAVHAFDLEHRLYHMDLSSTGQQTLVATASDFPLIRLLDLRTTSASHTLPGHRGKVLAVKWSPTDPNILVSGGSDGELKLWDIRRSNCCVCRFDMYRTSETHPIAPTDNRIRSENEGRAVKAHLGPLNGIVWIDNGAGIITTGNDEKVRVWDLEPKGGVNKLTNFGPLIRNKYLQNLTPCLSPATETELQYLLYPSDNGDIFVYRVTDGKMVKRLSRGPKTPRSCCIEYAGNHSGTYYTGNLEGEISTWGPEAAHPIIDNHVHYDNNEGGEDVLIRIQNEIEARRILADSEF